MQFIEDPDSRSRFKILCTREELYHTGELSDSAEKVLQMTMRTYTGVFSDYVYIREPEIAARLPVSENIVYEAMLELSRKKIIGYIPHSGVPMIYFPTAREDKSSLLIGVDIYEKRKQAMTLRTESMLDYAFSSGSCRVERMLAYFGEKDSGRCGKCDICRENKKNSKTSSGSSEATVAEILDFVGSCPSGVTLMAIEKKFGKDTKGTAEMVSFLCNEGYLMCENHLYRITDTENTH